MTHDCQVVSHLPLLACPGREPGETEADRLARIKRDEQASQVESLEALLRPADFDEATVTVYHDKGTGAALVKVEVYAQPGSEAAMLIEACRNLGAVHSRLSDLAGYVMQTRCQSCNAPLTGKRYPSTCIGVENGAVCEACHQCSRSGR